MHCPLLPSISIYGNILISHRTGHKQLRSTKLGEKILMWILNRYSLTLTCFHIKRSIGSHILVYRWLSIGIYGHLLKLRHCAWNTICKAYGRYSVQNLKFLSIVDSDLWPNIGQHMDSIGHQWNTKIIFPDFP